MMLPLLTLFSNARYIPKQTAAACACAFARLSLSCPYILKTKWDALNANYQKLTHMTKIESFGLLKRKEVLEKELAQLEKDITLLEGRGPLLVRAG